jgi:hypothetical protein
VGDEAETTCSRGAATERLLHDTLASVDGNILHLIQVSLKREENLARIPLASSMLSHPLLCFVSAALVLGSGDVPTLLSKVTRMWEAVTTAKAVCIMVVVSIETFAQEAAMVWDSFALCVKDAEDWDALEEREALEKVSRLEIENAAVLASAREDV